MPAAAACDILQSAAQFVDVIYRWQLGWAVDVDNSLDVVSTSYTTVGAVVIRSNRIHVPDVPG